MWLPAQKHRRVASLDWRKVKVHCCSCLVTQISQKYPKKGNNSVILKDKNSKKLHNFSHLEPIWPNLEPVLIWPSKKLPFECQKIAKHFFQKNCRKLSFFSMAIFWKFLTFKWQFFEGPWPDIPEWDGVSHQSCIHLHVHTGALPLAGEGLPLLLLQLFLQQVVRLLQILHVSR